MEDKSEVDNTVKHSSRQQYITNFEKSLCTVMALFDICGINSRSNFKTTEHDELQDVLSTFKTIGNPCQLALPPLRCVSFPLNFFNNMDWCLISLSCMIIISF